MSHVVGKFLLKQPQDIALYEALIKTASAAKTANDTYINILITAATHAKEQHLQSYTKSLLALMEHCDHIYPDIIELDNKS